MLLVKTKIGFSKIHGMGLFADQFIPKGTPTWKYTPKVDLSITKSEIESLPTIQKEYLLYYSYYDKKRDLHILPTDNQKFINHSRNENVLNIESTPDEDVASRDIQPGEELLCDYHKFDDTYFKRLGLNPEDLN